MPSYCRDFICIADRCSDSCCIGWEIDIDEKTAEYYMSSGGEFGERLKNGIATGDTYSFKLQNERCPFLNEKNLCDIILNLGEDKLCHICTEHPRFYEWFKGITEGGIGLCCEAAAELILERGSEEEYWEREIPFEECDSYDELLYNFLYEAREKIMSLLRNKDISLKKIVSMLLAYAEKLQDMIDNNPVSETPEIDSMIKGEGVADVSAMLDIFDGLEPIDEKWKPFIADLKSKTALNNTVNEKYVRNTGLYFIWRYFLKGVFDEEILSKVKLSIISMVMAEIMFASEPDVSKERCSILMKNYSKEIEYSEENLESLYDMTYTENVFSAESLIGFFK